MKKISLFMLMIFGIFMLFAADAAPETAQENAAAPETAQTPAETAPEQAQPAENAQEPVETSPETSQEPAENAQEPAETSPETSQEPPETSSETSQKSEEPRSENPQKVEYYRPYLGAGVPLIVIGSISFIVMMPAMGTMAFAASDACEGKDWDFCEELHDNNKKHHTAWTVGSVMTGVVGAGMIAVGSWLTSVEKPRQNQSVQLNSVAVLPRKNGMFASIGFKF